MAKVTLVCVIFLLQVGLVGANSDDRWVQQWVAIQFLVSLGVANPNIYRHIVSSFGPAMYSKSTVHHWAHRFRLGARSVKSLPRSGRPPKLTAAKLAEICRLLQGDKTLSIRELSRRVRLSVGTIHKSVCKVLQLCKRPAKWVAHLLMVAQKQRRVTICRQNLALVRRRANFMNSIVTGDESWIFACDPASHQATSVWLSTGETHPQKVRLERVTVKVMLILFFDSEGIILKRYIPQGHSINADVYLMVMRQLCNGIRRRRPQLWAGLSLQHQYSSAQSSSLFRGFGPG